MNKIVNNFVLAGDKFMLTLHPEQLDLLKKLVEHLLNIMKGFKCLKKQVI